jgi:hypothetical protein
MTDKRFELAKLELDTGQLQIVRPAVLHTKEHVEELCKRVNLFTAVGYTWVILEMDAAN